MPGRQLPTLTPPFNEVVLDASGQHFTPSWAKYFEALGIQARVLANLSLQPSYASDADAAADGVGDGGVYHDLSDVKIRTT